MLTARRLSEHLAPLGDVQKGRERDYGAAPPAARGKGLQNAISLQRSQQTLGRCGRDACLGSELGSAEDWARAG